MVQTATAPTYHYKIEQGSDEWHAIRRGVITASTVAKLITGTGKPANNDTSRTQLYQLLAERITGESEPSFYNDDMARGHLLEPYARDLYSRHYAKVQECGFISRTYGRTRIGYSPDGLVGDDGLIEIKCPRQKTHLRSLLTGEVPTEYMPQCQFGLLVSGRKWCDFISYAPGLPLFVCKVKRNKRMIEQLSDAWGAAEEQLAVLMMQYRELAAIFPATEPIQPEQEIVI
jgi:putative phage-type endonuclease